MKHFEHISPSTLDEAASLLNGGDAVLSAGGTDLVAFSRRSCCPTTPARWSA